MLILPAIDIQGGRVVRLLRGDFSMETVYAQDPVAVAKQWAAQGATYLHVVDLDGARTGTVCHGAVIKRMVTEAGVQIEVGGGVRSRETIDELLAAGADRVVLGTRAFEDPAFRKDALQRYGERVAVAVDSHSGSVVTKGWTVANVNMSAYRDTEPVFIDQLLAEGVHCLIYTEVTKDGTLAGPAFDGIQRVLTQVAGRARVIASGGVGSLEHLRQLKALAPPLHGVVVGKALYDGRVALPGALALCR